MNRRSGFPRFSLVCLRVAALLAIVVAQTGVQRAAEHPPDSAAPREQRHRQAVERGMIAAEQGEWALAIRYFETARQLAPGTPQVLFNLALATDRHEGRELPAISWYRAYLAAVPDADNAESVRRRIGHLEVMAEARVQRLLRATKEAAAALPEGEAKSDAFKRATYLTIKVGSLAEARHLAERCSDAEDRSYALRAVALQQSKQGDLDDAEKTADAIPGAEQKSEVYQAIAAALRKADQGFRAKRLLRRAREAADDIDDFSRQTSAYLDIGYAQATADDIEGAEETAGRQRNTCWKAMTQAQIAAARHRTGDKDGARQTIDEAFETAHQVPESEISGSYPRLSSYQSIMNAQYAIGDIAGARKTGAMIPSDSWLLLGEPMVKKQAAIGDLAGAEETIARLSEESTKASAYGSIVQVLTANGDLERASEMAARVPDGHPGERRSAWYRIAEAMLEASDREAAGTALEKAIATVAEEKAASNVVAAMCRIARFQLRLDDIAAARRSIDRAIETMAKTDSRYPSWQSEQYRELAELQFSVGDTSGARESIRQALQNAPRIPYDFSKEDEYQEMIPLQIRAGDIAGATSSAAQLKKPNDTLRAHILLDLAKRGDLAEDGSVLTQKIDAILAWTLLATDKFNKGALLDVQGMLEAAEGKSPEAMAETLVEAAEDTQRALEKVKATAEFHEA